MSGIIFINRNGLRWRDAPAAYGPPKTLYSRWKRWSEKGIFAQMLLELADQGRETETLMIPSHRNFVSTAGAMDATHLEAHHTATSMRLKKGGVAA